MTYENYMKFKFQCPLVKFMYEACFHTTAAELSSRRTDTGPTKPKGTSGTLQKKFEIPPPDTEMKIV